MPSITTRYIFEVPLKPVTGEVFQPTGFPDIGHAIFERPGKGGQQSLLVESTQSMANRLEAVAWNEAHRQPHEAINKLPWIEVRDSKNDEYLTSSRTEAHRLASAFIKDSSHPEDSSKDMVDYIRDLLQLKDDRPFSNHQIAQNIFILDPLCLIHGVFFADKKWPGQPKVARSISACIEADDVIAAHSGGVKRDHVRHSIGEAQGGSAEGYGSIPFRRTEFVANKITARFVIDRTQIKSYGLSDEATQLLETLALWEIIKLLSEPMRLRTACDLEVVDGIADQEGQQPPTLEELEKKLQKLSDSTPELKEVAVPLVIKWPKGK